MKVRAMRSRTTVAIFGLIGVACAMTCFGAQSRPRINPRPTIPQDDVVVYTENVVDFGAKAGDADFDNTAAFQAAIDQAHANGGGIVYVPSGVYHFSSNLVLKTGIALRGEWRDPNVPGHAKAEGSILAVTAGHGNANGQAFLKLESGAAVRKMSFWYPKQSFEKPMPYPWTIDGERGGVGVIQLTLYNSWQGIRTGHSEVQILNVRGTCLKTGCWLPYVGNTSWLLGNHYSPMYWARSELPGAPREGDGLDTLRQYLRGHLTGMRLLVKPLGTLGDHSFIYDLRVTDAHTGVDADWEWVQFINATLRDVRVGFRRGPNRGHGRRGGAAKTGFTGGVIDVLPGENTCGVRVDGGAIHLFGVTIKGRPARAIDARAATEDYTFVKCRFEHWEDAGVYVNRGRPIVAGCVFGKDSKRDIVLGAQVQSAVIAGNAFAGSPDIVRSESARGVAIDHTPLEIPGIPEWASTYTLAKERKPARPEKLFPVTDFGARAANRGETDCTEAFRKALAAAREAGGGTVFVPGGWWRLDGQIAVPSGVELRGCGETAGTHTSVGTTLFSYGHMGQEEGEPFITLEPGAGLRGMVLYYPRMGRGRNVRYPWAIRGMGKGVWVRDVRLANPWNGIDLGTHRCDDFELIGIVGDVRRNAIWASGGSSGGKIEYTGWWWTGDFKGYPNGPTGYHEANEGKEVTDSTTWPLRLGHTDGITMLCPISYKGAGPDAALLTLVNDKGVSSNVRIIGINADAYPLLRALACGNVDIVAAASYGCTIHSSGRNVSMYGTGWVGDIHCGGGRLNLYGVAGFSRLAVGGRGTARLYAARSVGAGQAHVAYVGAAAGRVDAGSQLDIRIQTSNDVATGALAGSAVHRLAPGELASCDSVAGWAGSGRIKLDTKNQKEGKGCLSATTDELGPAGWFSKNLGVVDTGVDEENGALRFWLYVSDASKIVKESWIELTSSGTYDRDEYSWNLRSLDLQNGWNDLTLPFSKAGKLGKPNPHNVRYFRVYSYVSAPITRKIDHIRVERMK